MSMTDGSTTRGLRFGAGDSGYRPRREQDLDIWHALRDIDAVAADALDHADDDVPASIEVCINWASRAAGRRLNRGLYDACARAHRNNPDELTVRPPQILQFESVAARLPVIRRKPGRRQSEMRW